MARGPAKAKAKAKRLLPGTSPKSEGSGVRDLERRLAEVLQREKATSEILRVISGSPTDVQPVFDAVAEAAARLCESFDAAIFRREGDRLLPVAHHGPIPINTPAQGSIGERFTLPLDRGTVPGRAVLDGRTIDVIDLQAEVDEFPVGSELARRLGFRTSLTVPLMGKVSRSAASFSAGLRHSSSRSDRSLSSKPSPTKPSSPLKTCGCSRSCRRRIAL